MSPNMGGGAPAGGGLGEGCRHPLQNRAQGAHGTSSLWATAEGLQG